MTANENRGNETRQRRIYWTRLILTFIAVIVISYGLASIVQTFVPKAGLAMYNFAWLAYIMVFLLTIVANISIIVPVPFAVSIMIVAATKLDPLLVAFVGSLGGAIGELSGYYAGYLGKKIAIPEDIGLYQRIRRWISRYGVWAIFFLALQPVIPFDIGGFIAGAAKMPVRKFWPALWLGKFPKYLVITYAGVGLINFLPSWLR
jgi:uncharacterized membrane protein YdjX (TVP38/TMEM64 family)